MAKRKTEAAMEKMQPDAEAVKAEEPSQEEKSAGESEEKKTEEHLPEEKLSEGFETGFQATYKVICRNKITKRIGGVDFTEGEGYTTDGFAASWFEAKDGYTMEHAE